LFQVRYKLNAVWGAAVGVLAVCAVCGDLKGGFTGQNRHGPVCKTGFDYAAAGKAGFTPITIFVLAPGAFFVLSMLVAVMNILRKRAEAKGKPLAPAQGCLAGDCGSCGNALCSGHLHSSEKKKEE